MKKLFPFSPDLNIQIEADAERDSKQKLRIVFELRGEISKIFLPEKELQPSRRDELWKRTCFEFFFGPKKSPHYWEINLSPSGDWAAYSFASYREGMKPELRVTHFQIRSQKTEKIFRLEASADLSQLALSPTPLELSATAVIETAETGSLSYWAYQHSGKNPNFHLRESFIEQL